VTPGSPRRRGAPRPTVIAAFLVVIGIAGGAVLALLRQGSTTSPASPTLSSDLGSLAAPATGTPAPTSSGSLSVASPGGSHSITIDSSLLAVLPASVRGVPLVENPDGEAHDLTDPALAGEASALAAALAIDAATSDWAYVSVVRLRPGVFSDAYFRSWRETFDAGACAQAGGVAQSSAEATIAGHQTFIGHCVGGILTYHVHLTQGNVIVSISGVGDQRFGQLVVEGLR
jgi:hypothetical protein